MYVLYVIAWRVLKGRQNHRVEITILPAGSALHPREYRVGQNVERLDAELERGQSEFRICGVSWLPCSYGGKDKARVAYCESCRAAGLKTSRAVAARTA